MSELEVRSPELGRLARAAHDATDTLRDALLETFGVAGERTSKATREGARTLPRGGGLADRVADGKFEGRARLTGGDVDLQVEADGDYNLQGIDSGVLSHPVFGGPVWVEQSVAPGFFSRPAEATGVPAVRAAISSALDRVRDQIERALG